MAKENKNENTTSRKVFPSKWEDSPIRETFDRFLDDRSWFDPFPSFVARMSRGVFPRVDVSETNDEIKVVADVPGVNPDNINIDIRDSHIRISGKIEKESELSEKPYRFERSYGEFQREFSLPAKVKENEVKASYRDGVLTITLPKAEEEKRKKIPIEKQ